MASRAQSFTAQGAGGVDQHAAKDYDQRELLGKGAFGEVSVLVHKKTSQK